MDNRQDTNIAVELVLLVALATLWGGSYTFIKLGVATIPPITLIAARHRDRRPAAAHRHAGARHQNADGCRDLAALRVPGRAQ